MFVHVAHTATFDGIQDSATAEGHGMLEVWMSHGDKVTDMPHGFKLMATTDACPIAGMADEERRFYAVQFHPEVTHTISRPANSGALCAANLWHPADWIMGDYISKPLKKSAHRWVKKKSFWGCLAALTRQWRRP